MKPYKHLILTRWNLGIYSTDNPYRDKVGDVAKWTDDRVRLFETYCLPSVLDQTSQAFTWLMAFDPNSPGWLLDKYEHLEGVEIIFEQPHLWLRKQDPVAEWLITSRFDNDDIYSPTFVEEIHGAFREQEEIIDIKYQIWDTSTWAEYNSTRTRNNSPFLSLIEPWSALPMTAMGRPHTNMVDLFQNRRIEKYLATQVIHGRNIMNKIPA